MAYLFVYGTLKRGLCRHHFLKGQHFVAPAKTRPHYRLFNVGEYPGMVRAADGLSIEGELWSVDDESLKQIDREEGCNTGLYHRKAIDLAPPHDAIAVEAYLYQRSTQGLVDCGCRW